MSPCLEPINQHRPAGVGPQALTRCYSRQRWSEITYEGRAGPRPAIGCSPAQRTRSWASEMCWKGINVRKDVPHGTGGLYEGNLEEVVVLSLQFRSELNGPFCAPGLRACS